MPISHLLNAVRFNEQGLVTAIVQDALSGKILMCAWMNHQALEDTLNTGLAHYYSRSRQKQWLKGEVSGHTQTVENILIDCDGDALILQVTQKGGIACHTGHASCFYRARNHNEWREIEPILKLAEQIYANPNQTNERKKP